MLCPRCKTLTKQIYIRHSGQTGAQRLQGLNCNVRRRTCPGCRYRFNTVEVSERELQRIATTGQILPATIHELRPNQELK